MKGDKVAKERRIVERMNEKGRTLLKREERERKKELSTEKRRPGKRRREKEAGYLK